MQDVFKAYLKAITDNLKTGDATEHTHRPALKDLLERLGKDISITNEPKRAECGAPDMSASRRKAYGLLTIGHVETKDVGINLDEAEKSEQLKRYLKRLYPSNLVLTDYLEFRWYVDGQQRLKGHLAHLRSDWKVEALPDEWKNAFQLFQSFLSRTPEPVKKADELAVRMANLTHIVRDMVIEAFTKDKSSQMLRELRKVFARRLIPDLELPEKTPEFADMFAQTIAYGLFAARCNHKESERFKRIGAAREIPKTNPFLRSLLDSLMGTDIEDEPYVGFVNDITDLLADTNIKKILEEFGKHSGKRDPVLHFYETFLATYDPEVREKRGVYYTPEPVVSYIARSVDSLLKTRFGCKQGLSDTSQVEYEKEVKTGRTTKKEPVTGPRVLILDPACGTGTFLYEVVYRIREQFMKRRNAGMWSGYVRNHLLNRLFGFELLVAPYAVAHFKLGMQLSGYDMGELFRDKWAYDFSGDERLGIYLTNTLERTEEVLGKDVYSIERRVVDEANAASRIKRDLPIMVILGNPPYSGISANMGDWVVGLLKGKLPDGEEVPSYYKLDGKSLGEKKLWLQDDYVKFIRWAQWRIERTGAGILGFITNHAYLDNPTFRGMRQQLMKAFNEIYIIDLHGNAKKKEICPDGSKDENVFDIQQGVAIGIFVKQPNCRGHADVYHADLWGLRNRKYEWLLQHGIDNTKMKRLSPNTPFYFFVPRREAARKEYEKYVPIADVMPVNVTGIVTARDDFVFDIDRDRLLSRVMEFRSLNLTDDQIRSRYFPRRGSPKYSPGDTRGWRLPEARAKVRADKEWKERVTRCLYRPFDVRSLYYVPWMVDWPRPQVTGHMLQAENLAITIGRAGQVIGPGQWDIVFCTRHMTELNLFRRGGNNLFPLYLYPDPVKNGELFENGAQRHINLSEEFLSEMEKRLKLKFVYDGKGDLKKAFGPEDIFSYIYAVFHSPTYRKRYAEFLKIDFPRVPLTSDVKLFRKLVDLGSELVSLHLLESPKIESPITTYPEPGSDMVEKGYPKYLEKEKSVYINSSQHFKGVPKQVWEFYIGGYQVCQKWLKDRRGRNLTYEERLHYQKVIAAFSETIRIMSEIDQAIPSWPLH